MKADTEIIIIIIIYPSRDSNKSIRLWVSDSKEKLLFRRKSCILFVSSHTLMDDNNKEKQLVIYIGLYIERNLSHFIKQDSLP